MRSAYSRTSQGLAAGVCGTAVAILLRSESALEMSRACSMSIVSWEPGVRDCKLAGLVRFVGSVCAC